MSDFLKPGIVVNSLADLAARNAVLPNLFTVKVGPDGSPQINDSVPFTVPRTGSLPEQNVDVIMDNRPYSVVNLDDEERELPTREFVMAVVARQARAVAAVTEKATAAWLDRQLIPSVWVGKHGVAEAVKVAHSILDGYGVGTGRCTVLGSALTNLIRPFSPAWSEDTRLAEVSIPEGEIPGGAFESWDIDRTSGYVFHPTAFAMTRQSPCLPAVGGSVHVATRSQGYRWLTDWDGTTVSERSVFDTFIGLKLIKDDGLVKRVVKVQL